MPQTRQAALPLLREALLVFAKVFAITAIVALMIVAYFSYRYGWSSFVAALDVRALIGGTMAVPAIITAALILEKAMLRIWPKSKDQGRP